MSWYCEQIEKLLDEIAVKYNKEYHETGGCSYYFRICTVTYVLFTSCWHDFGLHIAYQKQRGSKYHQMKMLDYEKDLSKISVILKTIKSCKPNLSEKKEV